MKGIGILFDIDALGGGFYGSGAWRLFMQNLRPERIVGCRLREGDTRETLNGKRREFCIAVFGPNLDIESIKGTFAHCSERGFAPVGRRFMLGPELDSQPLVEAGAIDASGRLVQDEWSRIVHDWCKDCDWGFAPKSVPHDLPPELKSELKVLRNKVAVGSASAEGRQSPSKLGERPVQPKKPWWKFWT